MTNDLARWQWSVEQESAGRADRAIPDAMAAGQGTWTPHPEASREVSRSQIQRLIDEGRVTADGKPLEAKTKLRAGMQVTVEIPPPRPVDVRAEDLPLDILFQDEHLLVINKPPGLTVHPSPTQMEGTLVNALLHHVRDLSGIGGELRPGIVHRIDKDTSGALVVSKTDEAHRRLVETFAAHDIERAYWALCYGAPSQPRAGGPSARIETRIGRSVSDRKKMAVLTGREGRNAITHYRVLDAFTLPNKKPFASWIEARLETGRTHQVRVHLTHLGHSLLGDPVYGTPSSKQDKWTAMPRAIQQGVEALPGQALHARVLGFKHPISGDPLHFEANPPPQFQSLLTGLKAYSTYSEKRGIS